MLQRIKDFIKDYGWAKIIPAFFALSLTATIFFDSTYLNGVVLTSMWVFIGVLLLVIFAGVMLFAGFTIMKALVHAGTSVALIVLLAESYCNLDVKTQAGLDALTWLLMIGSLYVFYEFGTKFFEACGKYSKRLGDDKKTFNGVFMITLFIFWVLMFGVALYQVVTPVVSDLCVNKPLEQ